MKYLFNLMNLKDLLKSFLKNIFFIIVNYMISIFVIKNIQLDKWRHLGKISTIAFSSLLVLDREYSKFKMARCHDGFLDFCR